MSGMKRVATALEPSGMPTHEAAWSRAVTIAQIHTPIARARYDVGLTGIDGDAIALLRASGELEPRECCDGTGFTGNPRERCVDDYEPVGEAWLELARVDADRFDDYGPTDY